ncbi:MAG: acyl carrier protein [Myxococcota bacterium]|nr:acyl carrier protein [Myxococcota bacterium]
MSTDLPARVRTVIAATFGVPAAELSDTSSSESIDSWDSMNHLHLIVALEGEFGVSFEPEQAVELTSVRAIERALRDAGAA